MLPLHTQIFDNLVSCREILSILIGANYYQPCYSLQPWWESIRETYNSQALPCKHPHPMRPFNKGSGRRLALKVPTRTSSGTNTHRDALPHAHSRFRLLQRRLHGFDLLEMAGHVRGHHHLNDQGPEFPSRDTPWRQRDESKKWKVKISLLFSTSNQIG